jgi:hypothetical protein
VNPKKDTQKSAKNSSAIDKKLVCFSQSAQKLETRWT